MSLNLYVLAIVLAANVNLYNFQLPSTSLQCNVISQYCHREINRFERMYTGDCYIRDPYPLLIYAKSYIDKADNNWNIDYFVRNYLLVNATSYYRRTYEGIVDPIHLNNALDNLTTEYNVFLNKFKTPGALKSMLVIELLDPIYTSQFDRVFSIIPTLNPPSLFCAAGSTFCLKTEELLRKVCTYEITRIPIWDLLTLYFEKIFNAVESQSPLQASIGKRAIDSFISNLNEKGSENVIVGELKNFTNNTFYQLIAEFNSYNPIEVTRQSNPRPNTTTVIYSKTYSTRQKVIDVTAISPGVLYSIPVVLVFLGIGGAVALIGLFYTFKPIKKHFPDTRQQNNDAKLNEQQQQTIEMEDVKKH